MYNNVVLALIIMATCLISIIKATFHPPQDCNYTFPDGYSMDLSQLGTLQGKYHDFDVYLNMCENIPQCGNESSICALQGTVPLSFGAKYPDSVPPTTVYDYDNMIARITESSGKAQCYSFQFVPRELIIQFQCGTEVSQTFDITIGTKPCQFQTSIITIDCVEPNPPPFYSLKMSLWDLVSANQRLFDLSGVTGPKGYEQGDKFYINTSSGIITQSSDVPIQCTSGGIPSQTALINSSQLMFTLPARIQQGEPFTFECQDNSLYLNFTKARGDIINVSLAPVSSPSHLSRTDIGPIDDGDDHETLVKWPMSFELPLHVKYQPFVVFEIKDIPTFVETQAHQLLFQFGLTGLNIRPHNDFNTTTNNSSLHCLTIISYPTHESTEPVSSVTGLEFNKDGTIVPLRVKFPRDHVKLALSIQIATQSTEETIKISSLSFRSAFMNKRYEPDYTNVPSSWDHYTPEAFPVDDKHPIKMIFGAYVGDKKNNPYQYGPSFSITFPKTGVPLLNTLVTLRSNSSIPLSQTTPSFYFTGPTKVQQDSPMEMETMIATIAAVETNETCRIPQFKIDVPVTHDQYSQQLTFDLQGVHKLNDAGIAFTLQCPNHLIIAANIDQLDRPIAFSIEVGTRGQFAAFYATSWVATPPNDQKNGSRVLLTIVIILLVLMALLGAGYIINKRFCGGDNQTASNNQLEPLIDVDANSKIQQ